jgi:hypothetical protein
MNFQKFSFEPAIQRYEKTLGGDDGTGEGMEDDGKRVLGISFRLIGQRGKIEANLVAHAVPDQAWQPNTIAKVMKLD